MTEQTQNLQQQVQQQATQSAQEFYGNSVGNAKSRLQGDRAQLEQFSQQLSEGDTKAQIQEMIDAYNELENAMDQATQNQGLQSAVSQAAQQTQQSSNGTVQQVQDTAEGEPGESNAQTTERRVDGQGYIMEMILDESGGVLNEDVAGNVAELPIEEEYIDEQGRVISRVRDEVGKVYEMVTDDRGNMVEARAV